LTDLRPDDLAATVIRAALDQVPELDVADIDDLMLGCGLPGGEQGFNMGRVVPVLLGLDHVPATTHHPVLRVLPADVQDGDARDQGRRGW
jgi:acetyl-CoA C-acetyltransferase